MVSDKYFERDQREPVEAVLIEDPYYSGVFQASPEGLGQVRDISRQAADLYQEHLRKITAAGGGSIITEIYLRGILDIAQPLVREGTVNGTSVISPDQPIFVTSKKLFLKDWEHTLFKNNLSATHPDRNQSGWAAMDEVEASLVKAVALVKFNDGLRMDAQALAEILQNPANREEIYELIRNPQALKTTLDQWFVMHPERTPETIFSKGSTTNGDPTAPVYNRSTRFLGILGLPTPQASAPANGSPKSAQELQDDKDFWSRR